jgi:hypothetical protein
MSTTVRIEIDEHTAEVLQTRATELGITVPQLIAELAALDGAARDPDAGEVGELDRRSRRAIEGSRVPHARVVQWLRTWGTPGFRQWPGR